MDVRIYDGGEQFGDRYTAVFPDGSMLGIGVTGNSPNGFCQHVGNVNEPAYAGFERKSSEKRVTFNSLPEPVQRAIRAEWDEWYAGAEVSR